MKKIFLLRAYGDFIIAIGSINNSKFKSNIEVIASKHFEPLFISLSKIVDVSEINIKFIDFEIKKSLFNFFTNKSILNIDTIFQLIKLKKYVSILKEDNYYLEHKSRTNLLNVVINSNFKYILQGQEIYKEWQEFLENIINDERPLRLKKNDSILILPDARLNKRKIPNKIQLEIELFAKENHLQCKTSLFSKNKINNNDYSNFDELINLIKDADFIITADSLPLHLCYILNKPHFIFYPPKGKINFFTPFVLKNNLYCSFDEKIDKFLYKWI